MRRRLFLNKPGFHSVGAIYAKTDGKGNNELILSDCNHTVSFSVGVYDEEDRENTLFKLRRMIDVLTEFRKAVEASK